MAKKEQPPLTAYPEKEAFIREKIISIDASAFYNEKIGICSSLYRMKCHGMCCSLGVSLLPEEAHVLTRLVKTDRDTLCELGSTIPSTISKVGEDSILFLAKKRRSPRALFHIISSFIRRNTGYLVRHPRYSFYTICNTCIFCLSNGFCGLELLSRAKGMHHWYYKPINCWMFPLQITKATLTVLKKDEYPFLPCNAMSQEGAYAFDVLREELSFLGKVIGRDLVSEIKKSRQ